MYLEEISQTRIILFNFLEIMEYFKGIHEKEWLKKKAQ